MNALLNGLKIPNFVPVEIKEKDLLEFGNARLGKRSYMAVSGGIQTHEVLKSRSQYKGITSEANLCKTKLIPFDKVKFFPPKGARLSSPKTDLKKELIYLLKYFLLY